MQLNVVQSRIVKSKPSNVTLLKGVNRTGKTTTAIYRTLYLKGNYCLYDDDKILILAKDSTNRDLIRDMLLNIEDETKLDYKTLFTNNIDRVEVLTIEDLINRYYFKYTNTTKKWYKIIQEDREKLYFVEQCISSMKLKYGDIKLFSKNYLNFLKDEVEWIKACGYINIDLYQNADRLGRRCRKGEGPLRLLKNSKERKIIFELFENYTAKLEENGLIDCEDISCVALKQAKKEIEGKFTHIIIDEAQELTKTQVDFITAMINNRTYSGIMYLINKSEKVDYKAWFLKGRKKNNLNLGKSVKNYTLSKIYKAAEGGNTGVNLHNSMENFEYLDLRYHRRYEFKRDSDIISEVIINSGDEEQNLKNEELKQLPVYSDIAAGEPIMINSELESEFYLPSYWIKGANDYFMLTVKGDSMIGADILDGDYVVIRKQHNAQNGDIVAVDLEGSATLKRLSLGKGTIMLMPENEKYDPIFIHDRQASIIGIAVGVIKNKN